MASASKTAGIATTPVQASRVPLFAPTRRPERRTWSVENSWGRVEITGRLGQRHRDLLDALRMVAEDEYWEADGNGELCLHLLVDPARVRATLGWDSISHRQIDSLLDDLVQTLVKAFEAKGETYPARSNIVAMVAPAREGGRPDGALLYPKRSGGIAGKPKPYLKVSFGAIWSRLLRMDLLTRYNLRALVKLRYGFSQAVARFCLTHQSANYSVARLAEILGAERRVDKLRRELEEDEAGLQALGIVLHDGVVKLAAMAAEPRHASTEPRRLAA